jgi:hypothetical protein
MTDFFRWWLAAPRWLRFSIALTVLAFSAYALTQGDVFIEGWIAGVFLLAVSFPRAIGKW